MYLVALTTTTNPGSTTPDQQLDDAVEVLDLAVTVGGRERDRVALAQALQNLGSHLGDIGAFEEALSVTEGAYEIMKELAAVDVAWRSALLESLSDLAARYGEAGQGGRALATAAEAVEGYRTMESLTIAESVNHAGALTNYASILLAAGHADEAIGPARAAVELMRELAGGEPARRPALALMLDAM